MPGETSWLERSRDRLLAQSINGPLPDLLPWHQLFTMTGSVLQKINQWCSCQRSSDPIGLLSYIAEEGLDIHERHDQTLRFSAMSGHVNVVTALIKAGANVHAEGNQALRLAAEDGHDEVVRILLSAGADVHAGTEWPLRRAASNGHLSTVQLLVEAGADIHANSEDALHSAVQANHIDVVKYLVREGADIHAGNLQEDRARRLTKRGNNGKKRKKGSSLPRDDYALRAAAAHGHVDIVRFLIEKGARVEAKDNEAIESAKKGRLHLIRNCKKSFKRGNDKGESD